MTFDELLKQMVQSSRKQPSAVLYGGNLQDNTTLSFTEQKYEQTPVENKSKNIFNTYGSSITDRDDRMFMTPQPQVPSNPELEALNDYFNQRRVEQFARGSQNMMISETIAKQAEQTASAVVRDEMDRRAGIRRAVLERTGLTPGQIQQQMVAEGIAGINPRTFDMREQQISDAVQLYYNLNNIPAPVTAAMTNPVPSTTASGVVPEPELEPEPETAPEEPQTEEELAMGGAASASRAGVRMADVSMLEGLNKAQLVRYITDNGVRDAQTITNSGVIKSPTSLRKLNLQTLQQIVIDHMNRTSRTRGGAGAGRTILAEPSAAPSEMEEMD